MLRRKISDPRRILWQEWSFKENWKQCRAGCKRKIPVQLLQDFYEGRKSTCFRSVKSSAKGDVAFADLNDVLPDVITQSIKEALTKFDEIIRGFADPDAVLSAVESRTSSPVRILRNSHFESNIRGIYPCGEGAGYAGGITSAAMDGIKVFEELYSKYKSIN